MATPPTSQRRRRHRTLSLVTTVATSVAVGYGAYRLAQWYWNDDGGDDGGDDNENKKDGNADINGASELRPLEEDPVAYETGATRSNTERSPPSTSVSSSWLSVATDWLVDAASSAVSSATIPTQNTRNRQQQPPMRTMPVTGRTRRQRLMHCRQKTVTAFCACLPALQPILEELTSTSRATRQLKELRKQQKDFVATKEGDFETKEMEAAMMMRLQRQQDDLWRHIVVENTTRMMASSYAYTLLFLSLTVQLHWISGNREALLHDSVGAQSSSTELAQAMLMQSHQYLMEDGIPLLVSTIRRSVEDILAESTDIDWAKPTQFLTERDIEQLLYHQLPQVLKYGSATARDSTKPVIQRNWIRFVLPDEECFDHIWDICCSPVWNDAQEQILQTLWYKLLRDEDADGWKRLFEQTSEAEQQAAVSLHQKPVAKVVAQFKKSSNLLFAEVHGDTGLVQSEPCTKRSSLLTSLQKLPTVLELGDMSFQQH
jgi:hypothetical protein